MSAREKNTNALAHGGEAAVKAIQRGQALTGPAAIAEAEAFDQLSEVGGRALMVKQLTARLKGACDMYYNALIEAGESGDLAKIDRYTARFGWLASATLRALSQLGQEEKNAPNTLDYERILQEQDK